jgi:hypothetical protein
VPGAIRFLYGVVLGISVGVIVSKLIGASSSGVKAGQRPQRPVRARNGERGDREKVEVITH